MRLRQRVRSFVPESLYLQSWVQRGCRKEKVPGVILSLNNAREEKRNHKRVFHELQVGIAVVSGPLGFHVHKPQFRGLLRDAAMSGMQISAEKPVDKGLTVKLWVDVDHRAEVYQLKLHGYVIWSRPDDTGMSSVIGIHLHDHPKKHMSIWEEIVAEEVRRFES